MLTSMQAKPPVANLLVIRSPDIHRAVEFYRQMEEIIIDECVVVPLYYDQVVNYVQPFISGIRPNAMNILDLRRVSVGTSH